MFKNIFVWNEILSSTINKLHNITKMSRSVCFLLFFINSDHTTLFFQTSNPWLKIQLSKDMFVAKVVVTNTRSCCLNSDNNFQAYLNNSMENYCTKYVNVYERKGIVFICSQRFKTKEVTIKLSGVQKVLTICEVRIAAYGTYK